MNTEHSPMVEREKWAYSLTRSIQDYLIELEYDAEIPKELFEACEDLLERR